MKKVKLKFTAKPIKALMFLIFCIFLLYLVAALIGLIAGTSSKFYSREEGFGFGKKKDKDDPGWSRWMKDDEMKKAYNVQKIRLKDESYESAGIPIIINDKEAYVDNGENHSLIIGASGSGKTWTIIDPLVKILGKAGESMVITDPKGEIYEHNANLLREKGYNVVLVNFRDPDQGAAWNPLSLPYRYWKDGKEDKAMELLEDLAMNILVDAQNNDPFWQKSAADYFTGLALGLFEDAQSEDEVNLNSINAMSTFGEERCGSSKYDKEYFKLKGELSSAYISAAATVLAPADTKGGITSTFRQKIRIFSSRQKLAEMLSYTSFDVRKIGSEKTAMFLKVHDEKTTYHALATIFVKQVYECLIDEAQKCENQKLKVRTNFILDEFANMPALKDVESMITASRSRNMRFNFGIQNFSQLNKVYGKDVAETIKGNCGNMFYLITTEYAALEEISKLLGDVKPKKAKEGEPQPPIRPLVTVSDLQQMKQFEMIIKRWRNQPYKTKHTPSFKIMKDGGWGYTETISDYPHREEREIKTFDIKAYVDSHRQEDANPFGGFGGGSPFMPPFGAPNIGHGMVSDNPVNTAASINPNSNVDDLVKKIDEQIAKIEAEEKAEKERLSSSNSVNSKEEVNDFEALVNRKYEEFKNQKIEEEKPETISEELEVTPNKVETEEKTYEVRPKVDIDDLLAKIDLKIAELEEEERKNKEKAIEANNNFEQEAKEISDEIVYDEITKPQINVDADSILIDDRITDDEFFDDFFGEDE